jgi:hypothetical protein
MIDESDPDNSAPQIFHAFQTAERCRELFPEHGTHMSPSIHYFTVMLASSPVAVGLTDHFYTIPFNFLR